MQRLSSVDLHVHSRFSDRSPVAVLRPLGCQESFAEPADVYAAARRRGMDFVTITDHDTLAGSLSIADRPGTFLSAELDTWFPEDGCKIHVVVLGVDEGAFADLLAVKASVYDLVDLLRATGVTHFVSHPLFSVNGRLTADTVEKILLLFEVLEGRNGARAAAGNRLVEDIVAGLSAERIARLAAKHGLEPRGAVPWRKTLVAGSDDHSGLFLGGAHTVALTDGTVPGLLAAIRRADCTVAGSHGGAVHLAHSIYAVAREFLIELAEPRHGSGVPGLGGALRRLVYGGLRDTDVLADVRNAVSTLLPAAVAGDGGAALAALLVGELGPLVGALHETSPEDVDRRIFAVARTLSSSAFRIHWQRLMSGGRTLRLDRSLSSGAAIGLTHLLAVHYYVSYHHLSADREFVAEVGGRFACDRRPRPAPRGEEFSGGSGHRIALFTDTVREVNGVAVTIRRLIEVARRTGVGLTVVTSHDGPEGLSDGVRNFRPCGGFALPRYPDLTMNAPALLDVLQFLEEQRFTAVHLSTPGPVGVVGLMAARLLHLPVAGTYHTDIPRYTRSLGGTRVLEAVAWRYMTWFYGRLDQVMVPSAHTGRELAAHGIAGSRIRPLPRWVDTEHFTPARRDLGMWGSAALRGRLKLLYAGRVSREKNLALLAAAFKRLCAAGYRADLVIAGDGPFRRELQASLAGYPAVFLGFVDQERLADVYASSDLFVFPSATDTFGNVVLEAQASGLPVIVSDSGGPAELMVHGETGLRVPADDLPALVGALRLLLGDPSAIAQMGLAAREFAVAGAATVGDHYSTILRFAAPDSDRPRVAGSSLASAR